ncbi:MAG: LLM class flavin-dependent oxidoreductase [Deltaproteobacteria bacterium]|nr:MAG: LLM class flavin-dependent oxidoreductase [Deltaproteobacteria bacterium]
MPPRRGAGRGPRVREHLDRRHGCRTRRLRGGRDGRARDPPGPDRHGGRPDLHARSPRARRRRRLVRAALARPFLRARPRCVERDHRRRLGRRALSTAADAHARDRHRAPPHARRRAGHVRGEDGADARLPPRLAAARARADLRRRADAADARARYRFIAWCGFPEEARAIDAAWRAKDRAHNVAAVTDEMVDRLAIIGSAEHCRARLAEFAAAGVTTPMIQPFLFDETAIWRTFESLAPS